MGARHAARIAAVLVAAACIGGLALAAGPAQAARPLTTALTDDVWFDGGPAWIARAQSARAGVVLVELDWRTAEPSPPPAGIDPTDPAGPEYSFAQYDAVVRAFAGSGIKVAFLVTNAPSWAEAPGGPASFEADGAWKPNASALGQFATALARRYSGSFPDPLNPAQALPRVTYFQAWAEANFSIHLAPQWARKGHGWAPVAPSLYRGLLNAFYAGVKRVHSDDVVLTTGVGPYGDPPGGCQGSQGVGVGCRMHPALFARELMCLKGETLRPESCPNPAHFDVLAADPYQVSNPTAAAFNVDDVSSPDLGKLTRVLHQAARLRRALPRGNKPLWVTEFSYDSNPPNPGAVSLATQARWLQEALYLFWKQGVNTVVWYLLRDQAPKYQPNSYYSGLFYYNGVAKPAFEAFRFPFVVWPSGKEASAWGIAPRGGLLTVQHRIHSSWKTLFTLRVSAGGVFLRTVSPKLRGSFRAVVAGESSLVWNR